MNLIRGGIVSFGGSSNGGGGGGSVSGIRSINALTAADLTINGVSGITVQSVSSNTINIGLTNQPSGVIAGSGIIVTQSGGNFIISSSGINTGSSLGKFVAVFNNLVSVTGIHNLGNEEVLVQVYDSNKNFILPDEITVVDSNRVAINFNTLTSGKIIIIG